MNAWNGKNEDFYTYRNRIYKTLYSDLIKELEVGAMTVGQASNIAAKVVEIFNHVHSFNELHKRMLPVLSTYSFLQKIFDFSFDEESNLQTTEDFKKIQLIKKQLVQNGSHTP